MNVSGHNKVKMEALRDLYKSLGLVNPQTYIQSGNVIFGVKKDTAALADRICNTLASRLDVRCDVILRTAAELRHVIASNPFSGRAEVLPNRLTVTFLAGEPAADAQDNIRKLPGGSEELHLRGRELYIHFPDGIGQSKLTQAALDRALKVSGTARNWNTVNKLLELAEEWQAA
jgi:uncharacterized protein (DUF1697 family)